MTKNWDSDPDWLAEISTVRKTGSKTPATPAMPKLPPATGTPTSSLPRVVGWNTHKPIPIISNTSECINGHTTGMDTKVLKQLSQGIIRPSLVLDLHGLGEGDAWLELVDFLHAAATEDHRCVLIIHGKGMGYGPEKNMGVIKVQMATWLAGHPRVLAFHTAQKHDGGTGAIYVYLKRHL